VSKGEGVFETFSLQLVKQSYRVTHRGGDLQKNVGPIIRKKKGAHRGHCLRNCGDAERNFFRKEKAKVCHMKRSLADVGNFRAGILIFTIKVL